jgi:hypothetical protein
MRRLLVALLLAASTAQADIFTAAAIAGAVGDIATTEVALSRGFAEKNIQSRPLRIGANVVLTGTLLLTAREFEKGGHKGWARAIRLVPAVVFGGYALKNLHTMWGGR